MLERSLDLLGFVTVTFVFVTILVLWQQGIDRITLNVMGAAWVVILTEWAICGVGTILASRRRQERHVEEYRR